MSKRLILNLSKNESEDDLKIVNKELRFKNANYNFVPGLLEYLTNKTKYLDNLDLSPISDESDYPIKLESTDGV